ncbi:2-succinyl-5-enolpyruvyl-6-hydroxy-3-cyclohexene-1-carboxylic-acid synthase [Enterococcus sp. DIV0176]|uniref:2-succinyl-5-enolpyruvyl-6-hydroxy-3- cyclohexene-1-carboxylic-acid synthase n=1 Tax=Enterococcus sp. DIV0176 TaxID=2774758 RepID=UPI003D2F9C5C
MTSKQETTSYLLAFIQGLKEGGLTKVVISPGSRSTPLALLLFRDPEVECYVDVDERSAGFFALGLAKGSKKELVALLCTSGTAAANYYPAICEAKETNHPLVVLTADRPPELREVGAPQTMNQQELYRTHVKKFVELAVPEGSESMQRYSYWQGVQLGYTAQQIPMGPVHANLPFREPLLPDLDFQLEKSFKSEKLTKTEEAVQSIPELSDWLEKKGLLIVGNEVSVTEAQLLIQLAEYLGWPIIGDPLTNLATCGSQSENYLKHAELIFSSSKVEQPEVVIRFGRLPVTKNVMLYLQKLTRETTTFVLVDEQEQWQDLLHVTNYFLPFTISVFCQSALAVDSIEKQKHSSWLNGWKQAEETAQVVLQKETLTQSFNESSASLKLSELLYADEQLFLSNSNAIRFVDRYAMSSVTSYPVFGNRGINGIDGIVSTAAGISAATMQRTYLLIGDLALFHDMNGLQMIRSLKLPVTIVLLNNNGGGIFSFLPQKQLDKTDFTPLFETPLSLDFAKVADLYDGQYIKPTSLAEFEFAIEKSRFADRWTLIEIAGNQDEPVQFWQEVVAEYREKIGEING